MSDTPIVDQLQSNPIGITSDWMCDEARKIERELRLEQSRGQEVYDYLVSINPDNIHLSVLEAVIAQRGVENHLKYQLEQAEKVLHDLLADVENLGSSSIRLRPSVPNAKVLLRTLTQGKAVET